MTDLLEIQGSEKSIGSHAAEIEQLRKFATEARKDAKDYRTMARKFPNHRTYYLKCATNRDADGDWYEMQADWTDQRKMQHQMKEAAE